MKVDWAPSALAITLATCAATAFVIAVVTARWELIGFGAPMIGVLASVIWQWPTAKVTAEATPTTTRCFESEQFELALETAAEHCTVLDLAPSVQFSSQTTSSGDGKCTLVGTCERWGRYPVDVRVSVVGGGGLLVGSAVGTAGEVHVYPIAAPQATRMPRTELPDRLGTHLTRHHGTGVEYADIRQYVPGDQLRAVNWAVSARRGRLHVTERLTDRAADIVVLVDTYAQAPGPASESLEWAVRGATQVVQSALQRGDRAGVVGLGREPRWLAPDIGRRQFYRVLDAVLAVGGGFHPTTGTLAPRAALPTGAIVVAFSTLLDTEFALALIDLRKRGHTVVVVDVLRETPFARELDPMLARMWRLERSRMYRDMSVVGVDVVAWQPDSTLDQAMHLVPDRSRRR